MAQKTLPEERQIIKLIEKSSLLDEQKNTWVSLLQDNGLTEALAEEIRQAIAQQVIEEGSPEAISRTRLQMEFANLVRRWRFSSQSKHFSRH